MSLLSWLSGPTATERLPDVFPMSVLRQDFVAIDCETIYKRILTDVLERTDGLSDDEKVLLWDNCLASEKQDGLVSTLAKAMVKQSELFLVYVPALKVIRKADAKEEAQIKIDYKDKGESKVGVYITFKNFTQSTMISLYSTLEYCGVNSFWKSMNLSKALQIKLNELRSSTGLSDSADVKKQAVEIAAALSEGRDIYIDAKDILELLKPDLTATNSAMDLIAQKRSFYLGLPASYITGQASKGMGDSGIGDAKKVEQGLRGYYFSIIKPVIETLFGKKTTFKSEDFDQIMSSMEVLKTFTVTDEDIVSLDNKTKIMNKMLGLPPNEKGDPPKEPDPALLPAPGQPVVVPPGTKPAPQPPPPKA